MSSKSVISISSSSTSSSKSTAFYSVPFEKEGSVVSHLSSVYTPVASPTLPFTYKERHIKLLIKAQKPPSQINSSSESSQSSPSVTEISLPITQPGIPRYIFTTNRPSDLPKYISINTKVKVIPARAKKTFIKVRKQLFTSQLIRNPFSDTTTIEYWEHNSENLRNRFELSSAVLSMLDKYQPIRTHKAINELCNQGEFPVKQV